MSRLYAASAVLIIVLAVTAAGFFTNTRTADEIKSGLELAYSYAEKDQPEAAEECVKNVRSLIAEKRKTVCLFISHNRLDDISQEIAKAYECIAEKDVNGFLVYCRSAITLTADMQEMELPLLYNLL